MSDEVDGVLFELVLGKHLFGRVVDLNSFVGLGVLLLEVLDSLKELLASSLLEKTHKVRSEGFLGCDWNFEDFESSLREEATLLVLEYVCAVDG